MAAWFFLFEGRFREGDPIFGMRGVYSSCIVPSGSPTVAKGMFNDALSQEEIDLVEIEESFEIDPSELDENDAGNQRWIDWHDATWQVREVLFDPWQVFEPKSDL